MMNKGNGRTKIIRFLEALFTVVFFMFIFLGLNKFNFLYKEPVQVESVTEDANKQFIEADELDTVETLEAEDDKEVRGAVNQTEDSQINIIENTKRQNQRDNRCLAANSSSFVIDKRKEINKSIPDSWGCNSGVWTE